MTEPTAPPKVSVFFYGSFINRQVLADAGLVPESFEVARLSGFDIRIGPLANVVRSREHSVWGIVLEATHGELQKLYSQSWVGQYLPEAVIVERDCGCLQPALCYIAPPAEPEPAADDYIDRIVQPGREYGFPESYLERLESFRPGH